MKKIFILLFTIGLLQINYSQKVNDTIKKTDIFDKIKHANYKERGYSSQKEADSIDNLVMKNKSQQVLPNKYREMLIEKGISTLEPPDELTLEKMYSKWKKEKIIFYIYIVIGIISILTSFIFTSKIINKKKFFVTRYNRLPQNQIRLHVVYSYLLCLLCGTIYYLNIDNQNCMFKILLFFCFFGFFIYWITIYVILWIKDGKEDNFESL